jgi:hypothetical protein
MLALPHETSVNSRSRNHHLARYFSSSIHRFLHRRAIHGLGSSAAKGFGFDSVGRASRSLCSGAEPVEGLFQAEPLTLRRTIFLVSRVQYR